jgi:hypothetical protein
VLIAGSVYSPANLRLAKSRWPPTLLSPAINKVSAPVAIAPPVAFANIARQDHIADDLLIFDMSIQLLEIAFVVLR